MRLLFGSEGREGVLNGPEKTTYVSVKFPRGLPRYRTRAQNRDHGVRRGR